jgi:hypothetical protein
MGDAIRTFEGDSNIDAVMDGVGEIRRGIGGVTVGRDCRLGEVYAGKDLTVPTACQWKDEERKQKQPEKSQQG